MARRDPQALGRQGRRRACLYRGGGTFLSGGETRARLRASVRARRGRRRNDASREERRGEGCSMKADPAAAVFEGERKRLTMLAYRMLGRMSEAEDAVQDAYL